MNVDDLRKKIDDIDAELVRLMNQRAQVVLRIGELKEENNDEIYSPSREETIYDHVLDENDGPLPPECVRAVYRELMSGCIALQKPVKISFLGPEGTFTHEAALSRFGDSVEYEPAASLEDVFKAVEQEKVDYGVVPVENSTEGGIHEALTRFLTSPLKVNAEIVREIHHALLSRSALDDITTVYSKSQVFTQCREWLSANIPNVSRREVSSTSAAAEMAAEEDGAAAIARRQLGATHGLNVVEDHIEDYAHNVTRFFVLGHRIAEPSGDDKTALLCSVRDKVGALHDLLRPFKEHAINMTKIESFPSPTTRWQYLFFIDFQGHPKEEHLQEALDEMRKECVEFRILGAFPRCEGAS